MTTLVQMGPNHEDYGATWAKLQKLRAQLLADIKYWDSRKSRVLDPHLLSTHESTIRLNGLRSIFSYVDQLRASSSTSSRRLSPQDEYECLNTRLFALVEEITSLDEVISPSEYQAKKTVLAQLVKDAAKFRRALVKLGEKLAYWFPHALTSHLF